MSTSEVAKISIETGQTLVAYAVMTDAGDHQIFSLGTIWSGKSGFTPIVRPDGIVSGRNVLSIHASNDTITIGGFTAYVKGVLYTVAATTDTFTRGTGPGKAKVISITMDCAGAKAVVPGEEGAGAAYSEVRAAAGGPPLIPVSSVEIGQIRTTVSTAQAVTAAEIFQVVGTHSERFDFPNWDEKNLGDGINAASSAEQQSHIKLTSALNPDHVGPTYKNVYVQYYTPVFAELQKTLDHVPADNAHSISSTQYYNGTIGSSATTLGAGSFTALLSDAISDAIIAEQDQIITVKFLPDRNKAPFILTQGKLGLARTFPVTEQNQVAVTVAAESKSASFLS
ncbi:hypothetical protein LCGC14_0721460 [marine sediment metagenome]|uniref:Uncharacterized protein n=1 Tax=marine sediment metagenome TaxID=412755 RepID=A0A0F9TJJ2_9ZZZZ